MLSHVNRKKHPFQWCTVSLSPSQDSHWTRSWYVRGSEFTILWCPFSRPVPLCFCSFSRKAQILSVAKLCALAPPSEGTGSCPHSPAAAAHVFVLPKILSSRFHQFRAQWMHSLSDWHSERVWGEVRQHNVQVIAWVWSPTLGFKRPSHSIRVTWGSHSAIWNLNFLVSKVRVTIVIREHWL